MAKRRKSVSLSRSQRCRHVGQRQMVPCRHDARCPTAVGDVVSGVVTGFLVDDGGLWLDVGGVTRAKPWLRLANCPSPSARSRARPLRHR